MHSRHADVKRAIARKEGEGRGRLPSFEASPTTETYESYVQAKGRKSKREKSTEKEKGGPRGKQPQPFPETPSRWAKNCGQKTGETNKSQIEEPNEDRSVLTKESEGTNRGESGITHQTEGGLERKNGKRGRGNSSFLQVSSYPQKV